MAARVGWQIARAARDTAAILRWSDRFAAAAWDDATWIYDLLAEMPSLRDEALHRLREQLRLLDAPGDSLRPPELTRAEAKARGRKDARRVLVTVGEILLELGHIRQGLDTLDLATREGWDIALFRRAATARLAVGDTAGASRLFALVAADPGSSPKVS